jgi:hypothetical protein
MIHRLHLSRHARHRLLTAAGRHKTQRVVVAARHHALLNSPSCLGIALCRRQHALALRGRAVTHHVVTAQNDAVDPVAVHVKAADHYSCFGVPSMALALVSVFFWGASAQGRVPLFILSWQLLTENVLPVQRTRVMLLL